MIEVLKRNVKKRSLFFPAQKKKKKKAAQTKDSRDAWSDAEAACAKPANWLVMVPAIWLESERPLPVRRWPRGAGRDSVSELLLANTRIEEKKYEKKTPQRKS